MVSRALFVSFIVAILVSCTVAVDAPKPAAAAAETPSPEDPHSGLVVAAEDGGIWLVRAGSRTLERWTEGDASATVRAELPILPRVLRPAPAGGVIAVGSQGSVLLDRQGTATSLEPGLVAPELRSARVLSQDRLIAIAHEGNSESLVLLAPAAERKRLAGPFASIDSFDIAPDGSEIAFSASRGAGFDIGLVSVEGSDVRWIGPDPLDERNVKWAPRGNKIAYVIETPGGSVVRSVHIPTGFQVSAPLPVTEVRDVAWEPAGERLVLLLTSADAGERVELMRYDGTERREAVPAVSRSERPDQLAGFPEAVIFPPDRVRYNETLPLVVWATGNGPFAWNEARSRVQQNRRIGSIVVARGAAARPALWEAIAELPWVDPAQVFLVATDAAAHQAKPAGIHLTILTRDEREPEESDRITVVRSGSDALEEFAVLWLRERLRGFEREHDGS